MTRFGVGSWGAVKNAVRRGESSPNRVTRFWSRCLGGVYRGGREAIALASDRTRRSFAVLRLQAPEALHQDRGDTALDRFPEIFAAARLHFGRREELNFLSFGCSTGEEVLTLRRYFPSARITGAELNPVSLAACRALDTDRRIDFVPSSARDIEARGPYDAIFCMAVLQRIPLRKIDGLPPPSLADHYPFEKFDQQISQFDRWLKPSGLLVVHAKAYFFEDASAAPHYLPCPEAPERSFDGRKYDRRSRLVEGDHSSLSMFVKKEEGTAS